MFLIALSPHTRRISMSHTYYLICINQKYFFIALARFWQRQLRLFFYGFIYIKNSFIQNQSSRVLHRAQFACDSWLSLHRRQGIQKPNLYKDRIFNYTFSTKCGVHGSVFFYPTTSKVILPMARHVTEARHPCLNLLFLQS